eukprot:TRINITY_DN5135_c0_g1_i4.p1 TRINITY_DN5135_c0_g1~~TRINITY_DN5135_c0_g1_i4.p1  ORF type:complete len:532 (+),score=167.90 TRINITY_DN5135_c0_g1_i4:8-1603(+)
MLFRSKFPDIVIPEDVTLPDFVMESFGAHPDKVALIDAASDRKVTYGELHGLIYRVSCGLYDRGLRKGDVVSIHLPNCIEYIVVFHAVALLGAIVSTISPLYTVQEITHHLQLVKPVFILSCPMFISKIFDACKSYSSVKEVFSVGDAAGATSFVELLKSSSSRPPKVHINPKKDTVLIPFSSGTTGLPKGVMLSHYNIISNILQTLAEEITMADDVYTGFLPFFHVYALMFLINFPLKVGATLVIIPKFDFVEYLGLVKRYSITTAHVAPPVMLAFAKHPAVDKADLSSLRVVFSGAAPLDPETQSAVAKRLPGTVVKQGYGMTEASPVTHITPDRLWRYFPGAVGVLLPSMVAKIVDPTTGKSLGVNQDGELWLAGPNIMQGYYDNPEATAHTIDKDGFLHTGDIARVDFHGVYYIVDRLKELVKYKGYQVAPAELEGILISHPLILDAAVIGKPDLEAGELPLAFVVLKPGAKLREDEVIEFAASKTAPAKRLRGGVQFIDVIPKSAAGKILRRLLRDKIAHPANPKL